MLGRLSCKTDGLQKLQKENKKGKKNLVYAIIAKQYMGFKLKKQNFNFQRKEIKNADYIAASLAFTLIPMNQSTISCFIYESIQLKLLSQK